jgi:ATP diphosphatase
VTPGRDIQVLLAIMAALRDPSTGCAWDQAQTFASIAPYTIEEAYEVAEAISRGDLDDLRDELGDLLLQVVFHARMAEEAGAFAFGDVVQAITEKLVRRHPHVFGQAGRMNPEQVDGLWQRIKAEEKAAKAARNGRTPDARLLSDVPAGLPALTRALKLQAKASTVGFDWNDIGPVVGKIREEAEETAAAVAADDREQVREEIGDLMFALVNLARHYDLDVESALRDTNAKFERRFAWIEAELAKRGKTPASSDLAEMDALWDACKRAEKERARS